MEVRQQKEQMTWANRPRQPTPGVRFGCISASLARRGCADCWAKFMGVRQLIAGLSLLLASTVCVASEICWTLEEKVTGSDLVAVGTVMEVQLKQIRTLRNHPAPTQDTKIRFRIEECLSGTESGEISIEAHSVYYTDSEGSHAAT